MSEQSRSVYVVMRRSGAVMPFLDALSGGRTESEGPYLHILDTVANEMQSAGSTWDAPSKLFLNGLVVVDKGLADLAWAYRQDAQNARDAAQREVKNLHMPPWLPADEQKPGYNPPGIDTWTVKKAKRP